jgi:hypothetical protein
MFGSAAGAMTFTSGASSSFCVIDGHAPLVS